MPADVLSRGGLLVLMVTLGLLATSCGGGRSSNDPIKIAFITDCGYPFTTDTEPLFAAADLPFLQRGAKLRGREPSNGVTGATVAGRPVQLLRECVPYGDFASLLGTLRRFVEGEGADIVVGPDNQGEGLVIKDYAEEQPGVTFLTSFSGEQSTTLRHPVPNLFRFGADTAQSSAGLGAYAYRALRWRSAVMVYEDDPAGWAEMAGFVAEFCSLGGHITKRVPDHFGSARGTARTLREIPTRGVDGVVSLKDLTPTDALPLMNAWAKRYPRWGQRLLVNADQFSSDALKGPKRDGMRGLVGVSNWPLDPAPTSPAGRFATASARFFPGMGTADFYSYDEMEPVLEALKQVHGDLSQGQRQFRKALAQLHFSAPNGPTTLDARHQAIAPTYLRRVERKHGKLVVRQIAVIPKVEQTFGGYFSPTTPPPGRNQPVCRRRKPPAWVSSVPATK
jgi:branched-chain amino acid transport system substrate-binding protein